MRVGHDTPLSPADVVFAGFGASMTDHERPFRLPGGHIIPILAFCSSNFIVYWSGWTIVWKLMIAIGIGYVLLACFALTGKVDREMHWGASLPWIAPWLAGRLP